MKILLDDIPFNESMYPFGKVRSMVHCRIGILTIYEKWNHYFPGKVEVASERSQYYENEKEYWMVPANIIPSAKDFQIILQKNESAKFSDFRVIEFPWHIFQYNDWAIRQDFETITAGRTSSPIPEGNRCSYQENIFIEEGAQVKWSILNAEMGPIYVGRNAEIMEGSLLRGPVSIGENATVKMGAKIYGATSIGPYCLAGGEIKNAVLFGYSNKAHDGYLGDAVIGEWCNLGAGTSNSNLKNNGSKVKVWLETKHNYEIAGNKCGLMMGDYSRSAINTSFNTGTVVGVCCNIYGNNIPEKFIKDFSWGEQRYHFEKAISDIRNWKKFKNKKV
ncbi:MAG: putative sugar nucleotidyl transferase, partial [Ginsengibacter sp.]